MQHLRKASPNVSSSFLSMYTQYAFLLITKFAVEQLYPFNFTSNIFLN